MACFNQTLGNRFLNASPGFCPPSRTNSRAAWLGLAQAFNEASERLAPHGMQVGYHNHHTEFLPMEGELPWDIFFGNTGTDVIMQFDTGNALMAGAHAAPFLRRYPGRAITVHLKEYSKTNDGALIGEGDVDWPEIFHLCETVGGTEWYIVEQESYAHPPLACVDLCLQRLKEMGK